MMKDFLKIIRFLEKNGREKDSDFITYISEKYADGDLVSFFEKGLEKDLLKSEFGNGNKKKKGKRDSIIASEEEEATEELLKNLYEGIKE